MHVERRANGTSQFDAGSGLDVSSESDPLHSDSLSWDIAMDCNGPINPSRVVLLLFGLGQLFQLLLHGSGE